MSASPRPYVIAVPTAPSIACPKWCTVPYAEHLRDLVDWEGVVIHHSGDETGVRHSCVTYADGTPTEDDPPLLHVDSDTQELRLHEAEDLAHRILAAVKEARA